MVCCSYSSIQSCKADVYLTNTQMQFKHIDNLSAKKVVCVDLTGHAVRFSSQGHATVSSAHGVYTLFVTFVRTTMGMRGRI